MGLVRAVAAVGMAGLIIAAPVADAHWLDRLAWATGEVGGTEGAIVGRSVSHGIAGFDRAAAAVRALPFEAKWTALAAHVTSEGHWKFVNRTGEVFTAGTPDEMKRVVSVLAPDAAATDRLAFYLSEETLFDGRAALKDLPKGAELSVVVGEETFALLRRGEPPDAIHARVRPNLTIAVGARDAFREALAQLKRPFAPSQMRVIALEPGGPQTISTVPKFDTASGGAAIDVLDPDRLIQSLSAIPRQTVLLTGRVEGGTVAFRPLSGAERNLLLADLRAAAAAADVDLLILHSPTPRQPGGRNWFWQTVSVRGLDSALKRANLGDFLDAIGASRGELSVTAALDGSDRVRLTVLPAKSEAAITDTVGDWLKDAAGHVTGHVISTAVHADVKSDKRQQELENRFIPGIPSALQIGYVASVILGLLALGVLRGWWRRLWPVEQRGEYASTFGYGSATVARGLAFGLIFLPVAAGPAFVVAMVKPVLDAIGVLAARLKRTRT